MTENFSVKDKIVLLDQFLGRHFELKYKIFTYKKGWDYQDYYCSNYVGKNILYHNRCDQLYYYSHYIDPIFDYMYNTRKEIEDIYETCNEKVKKEKANAQEFANALITITRKHLQALRENQKITTENNDLKEEISKYEFLLTNILEK